MDQERANDGGVRGDNKVIVPVGLAETHSPFEDVAVDMMRNIADAPCMGSCCNQDD